ncbi:hypothetical protein IC620_11265 [Hazenella sp. IB182357]|uniref:Uncharacterized protein n=1 Tax=Polycladospora coralii TaxID=2771432 RepID=A0A926N9Z1_9BACL|nr:hypothetical protein [Polycladospora coralii]MBD1372936.1 hypothetical protein [Polycladospora coralii]MBS7531007.1 hypothetical protein [Polycladospora coralii]
MTKYVAKNDTEIEIVDASCLEKILHSEEVCCSYILPPISGTLREFFNAISGSSVVFVTVSNVSSSLLTLVVNNLQSVDIEPGGCATVYISRARTLALLNQQDLEGVAKIKMKVVFDISC